MSQTIYKELYNFLPQNLSLSSQKYGFGIVGLGSEIRNPKKPIPDRGSRSQKGTGFGSATLGTTSRGLC
jgi:hypothetical protein